MVNQRVATAAADLFGSTTLSDCTVVFCRERTVEKKAAKRVRQDEVLAEPLPAHKFVLWSASERFRAQVERWRENPPAEGSQAPPADDVHSGSGSAGPFQFRVPLASEAEVPTARAAIAFAYTGRVQAGSIREALEVRQQAAYLQIEGCTSACDEWVKQKLEQASGAAGSGVQVGDGGGGGSSGPANPVLDFYACVELWPPNTEDDNSFTQLLVQAKSRLVAHFRDTLATLNTPALRQQLLDLPAEGLAALLESDDFGTDTESTVLLLLATWMDRNYTKTDAAIRERLCRLLRLVQLSRAYLTVILAALALDHELKPKQKVGWFPIGVLEAAFVAEYARASEAERKRLLESKTAWDLQQPTYSLVRRAQSPPPEGLAYNWSINKSELEGKLGSLAHGQAEWAYANFEGITSPGRLSVQGFDWDMSLKFTGGKTAAGVFLECRLPPAMSLSSSKLSSHNTKGTLVPITARVEVHRKHGTAAPSAPVKVVFSALPIDVGWGRGYSSVLPLRSQVGAGNQDPSNGGGSGGKESNGGVIPLAALADYLHGGKMTGTLTLLRP